MSALHPSPVPHIADFLRSLTREQYLAIATSLRAAMPVAERDQMDAATADVMRAVRLQAQREGVAPVELPTPAALPNLVLMSVLDVLEQWAYGRLRTCLHSPDLRRPEPVMAAAWKPDIIVCAQCSHLLKLPRGSDADRTCDECGHVVDKIHLDTYSHGRLLYLIGRCRDCHRVATAEVAR